MAIRTVCFFNSAKVWGGGEKWHFEMATEMHKQGYKVIVFSNKNSALLKKLQTFNIKVFPINVSNFSFANPLKIREIANILKEYDVSHIIINLSADLKLAGLAAKFAKVKHIIYRRGSAIPIKNSISNRYIFKNIVTNVIANTEATKRTINQNFRLIDENKIKVIYNGICLEDFDKLPYQSRRKGDKFIIGNIGRLVEQKAQHYLIRLAKILKQSQLNFEIVIGGTGKLENDLLALSRRLDVTDVVKFVGFVDNSRDFLMNTDLFVLTSLWEGFGYVLVEAMACRVPTVAFNISSNPEIIEDNETGFLVEHKNIEQLAEKIIYLYNNKDKLLEMGKKSRLRVEQNFTFRSAYKNFVEYLHNL